MISGYTIQKLVREYNNYQFRIMHSDPLTIAHYGQVKCLNKRENCNYVHNTFNNILIEWLCEDKEQRAHGFQYIPIIVIMHSDPYVPKHGMLKMLMLHMKVKEFFNIIYWEE